MKRQFAKNLTSNWMVYIVSALISLALTPFIIDKLGLPAYGVWILVGSFSGYLGLFDFGIGTAVVRYVARFQQTGDSVRRNEIIATSFYTAALLAIGVLAATAFLVVKAPALFAIPADIIEPSRLVIMLIGISIAFAFPMGVFSDALSGGLWRVDLFNKVSLTVALVQAIMTIGFLEAGWGLPGLGAAVLVCSAGGYIWRMRILFGMLPDLSIRPRLAKWPVLRQIGGYTAFSFLLVLSGRMAFYSDSFIVGFFKGVEEVAIFGIAVKLVEYLRQLVFTLSKLFMPVTSRYDPDIDKESLRRIFYAGSRVNLLFSLPLAAGLFFWGKAAIRLWIGPSFDYSATILQVLLIGHVLSFTQGISGELLLGAGRHRVFAIWSLIAAVVNIGLSIILVKHIGLIGVAWGTTIPLALLSLGYLPWAALKMLDDKFLSFFNRSLLPAVKAALLPIAGIIATASLLNKIGDFVLWGVVIAGVGLITAWVWGLLPEEKAKLKTEIYRYRS